MACRSCGGRPGQAQVSMSGQSAEFLTPTGIPGSGELQQVEYLGPHEGMQTIRGRATKYLYRFSALPQHRVKWVAVEDIPWFRQRLHEWKVNENTGGIPTSENEAPPITAPGPPSGVRT